MRSSREKYGRPTRTALSGASLLILLTLATATGSTEGFFAGFGERSSLLERRISRQLGATRAMVQLLRASRDAATMRPRRAGGAEGGAGCPAGRRVAVVVRRAAGVETLALPPPVSI